MAEPATARAQPAAAPAAARRRRPAPPRALAALMAASLLLTVTWSVVTPAFQAPDEQSHFAYAQYLAETFDLPGDPGKPIYSTEHRFAASSVGADQVAGQRAVKPQWSEALYRRWEARRERDARGDGGGPESASTYPPLSYLWGAGAYRLAGGDFFDRLTGARIASGLWLPVTVLASWLLAGELLGRRRLMQTVAAAVPALAPMVAFISGSVGPDGMMYALWSLALWLGVRILRRGLTPGTGAALAAVVALACVVKTMSYALLPALAVALGAGLWRTRPRLRLGALSLAPLVAILGGWIALARALGRPAASQLAGASTTSGETSVRELLSYLWQFYLPRIPGQDRLRFGVDGYPAFEVWVKHTWASFGWLEVQFGGWVYLLCAAVTVAVLAGALAALWDARQRVDPAVAAFLAVAVGCLLAGLHWTDYQSLAAGEPFMQGRYLFPLVALAGVAVAAAVGRVAADWRGTVAGVALAGLVTFDVACFGLVLERFYA